MNSLFISAGIDVGSDFSYMTLALLNQTIMGKPFKIVHNNIKSLERAVQIIQEASEVHSLPTCIVMESTGVYHYPLYCYLRDKGFSVFLSAKKSA